MNQTANGSTAATGVAVNDWDSLASLGPYISRRTGGLPPFAPIDAPFFDFIHKNGEKDFSNVFAQLQRVISGKIDTTEKGLATPIFDLVRKAVQGGRPGEFMGPMCCPMTKTRVSHVRDSDYLITEKSDGIRAISVTKFVEGFPLWIGQRLPPSQEAQQQESGAGGTAPPPAAPFSFGLLDAAMLEQARGDLLATNTVESDELNFGPFGVGRLCPVVATPQTPAQEGSSETAQKAEEPFSTFELLLTPHAPPPQGGGGPPNAVPVPIEPSRFRITRTTSRGRYFTYLFDRSMSSPNLIFEEFTFPNLVEVIMDGELILPIGRHSLRFAAFDLFSFTLRSQSATSAAAALPTPLTFHSMRERMAALNQVVMRPMVEYYQRFQIPFPTSVELVAKRMFEVSELNELIGLLSMENGRHVFAKATYNDGLIFTPNRFDLMSGAAEDQLKWKWPDSLTVDWLLTPSNKPPTFPSTLSNGASSASRSIPIAVFNTQMFFRKKRLGSEDSVGHTWYGNIEFENPKQLVVGGKGKSEVAECFMNPDTGRWSIIRLREDKNEANSAVTVVSVLESICEMFDLDALVRALGQQDDGKSLLPKDLIPRPPQKVDSMQFILRCTHEKDGSTTMRLQWTVKLSTVKHPIVCNHCKVSTSCYGLGYLPLSEDPEGKLEELLAIHLANDGGCHAWSDTTVEAQFDPERGMWAIGSLGRHKNAARVGSVLQHLQAVAAVVRGGGKLQPLEGSQPAMLEAKGTINDVTTNQHYASRTKELGFGGEDDRSALRRHNNWVKAVLIAEAVKILSNNDTKKISVLDLCCGRGGDLQKWKHMGVKYLMMVDSCFEAVAAAAQRYSVGKGLSTRVIEGRPGYPGVPAYFHVVDCFSEALKSVITAQKMFQAEKLNDGFDLISCQFSMHYAFTSESCVKTLLSNIATSLKVGGLYVATTPDDRQLSNLSPKFSNSALKVNFLPRQGDAGAAVAGTDSTFGQAYRVSYDVAVVDEVEYVVPMDKFTELAAAQGLEVVTSENFEEFRERARHTETGVSLFHATGKSGGGGGQDDNEDDEGGRKRGRSSTDADQSPASVDPAIDLTPDQKVAAAFYRTMVLKKVK